MFSLIIVTIANSKGGVHGSWKKFYRRGHQRIFPKFFQEGPKVVKFFFPLETKKTTFFAQMFLIQGGPRSPCSPSDAHGCVWIRNVLTKTIWRMPYSLFSMIIRFLSVAVLTGYVNLYNINSNRFIVTNTLAALNRHVISSPDNN